MFFFATLQSLKETLHLLIIDIVQQASAGDTNNQMSELTTVGHVLSLLSS